MNFKPKETRDRLILSLDVPTVEDAKEIVKRTKNVVGVFKLGMQLQFAGGIDYARELADEGLDIFLDVKLLDIDNTMICAMKNLQIMGVKFVTIHAYPNTMRAVVNNLGKSEICLLGVTVLTSMNDKDLKNAGYRKSISTLVKDRCIDAHSAGMNGIVCSPLEVKKLRKITDSEMIFVTPGIRPEGSDPNDQKRIATPFQAILNGSDYLVVGRPITNSKDMQGAAEKILEDMNKAQEQLDSNQPSLIDRFTNMDPITSSRYKFGTNPNNEAKAA